MATTRKPLEVVEALTESDKSMLYEGMNVTQLALMLKMERRDVGAKLFGKVQAVGQRRGQPIYSPKEALPYLVKPAYDIEAYVRTMSPADLPKMLTKEYWAAMRSKQEFELKAGELWHTSKVVQEVGELMKLIRMSVLLTVDTVEREVELTDKTRKVIKDIMDGMLRDLHARVRDRLPKKEDDGDAI